MPMLEFSEVLTDEDLVEIIKSQDSDAQQAIANRSNVSVNLFSEQVRDHLVTHHELSSDTVMDLFFNARERTTANLIMKVQKRKWILVILLNSFTVMVV
jgi:uncharacterized protein (DUF2336 family)